MIGDLAGQTTIVTGSSRGIGAAIAERFAEAGANVVVNSRNHDDAAETADRLARHEGAVRAVEADVGDPTDAAALVDATVEQFGGVDVLVNNAGIAAVEPAMEMTPSDWQSVLDVNLSGTFYASQAAGRRMVDGGDGGQIINLSSTFGQVGFPGRASYSASKGGIDALTRTLAVELGHHDVCVNAIAPGPIRTEMIEQANEARDDSASEGEWPRYGFGPEEVENWTLLGRYGRPEEIGNWALFLASGDHYATGQVFTVDGGWLAFGWGSKAD
jgi:3-oxoacyl-[acyl-carrier protein] reductase